MKDNINIILGIFRYINSDILSVKYWFQINYITYFIACTTVMVLYDVVTTVGCPTQMFMFSLCVCQYRAPNEKYKILAEKPQFHSR